jgi:hypothetical protein
MIAYDLTCENGHTFEGWFEDSAAFASQKKKGLVACPVCNDPNVKRLPSRFAIKTSPAVRPRESDVPPAAALAQITRDVAAYVEKNFDNVGCDFAKEALKIHYGATEPRNIRGVSTQAEEKLLKQEGVEFIKIPVPAAPDSES